MTSPDNMQTDVGGWTMSIWREERRGKERMKGKERRDKERMKGKERRGQERRG